MSRFVTKIPVAIEQVIALLPKKSGVESVVLSEDAKEIEIVWENDWLLTPFTFPVEWTAQMLRDHKTPEKVTAKPMAVPIKKAVDKEPALVDKKAK